MQGIEIFWPLQNVFADFYPQPLLSPHWQFDKTLDPHLLINSAVTLTPTHPCLPPAGSAARHMTIRCKLTLLERIRRRCWIGRNNIRRFREKTVQDGSRLPCLPGRVGRVKACPAWSLWGSFHSRAWENSSKEVYQRTIKMIRNKPRTKKVA